MRLLVPALAALALAAPISAADKPTSTGSELGGTSSGAASLGQTDRDFIAKAASGGMFEVKSSQLALDKKLRDDKEKTFARMMVEDHSKANRELMSLTQGKGIDAPKAMLPEHQRLYDDLKDLDGDEFEKKYHDIQVQAHQDTIALFQREAQDGHDGDLRQFATRTLPTLEKHLAHLQTHEHAIGK
jgi:putative membrane protein